MAHGCADEHPIFFQKICMSILYIVHISLLVYFFLAHLAHTFSLKLRPNLELANTLHPQISVLLTHVPN
jgi:hypothetical protein